MPVLDLTLFRNRPYAAATVTAGFTGAALFGAGLLFPLYFQIGRGEGTIQTGLLLISLSIGTIAMSGQLQTRGVDLVVLDQGIDTSTAVGRMFFQILGASGLVGSSAHDKTLQPAVASEASRPPA